MSESSGSHSSGTDTNDLNRLEISFEGTSTPRNQSEIRTPSPTGIRTTDGGYIVKRSASKSSSRLEELRQRVFGTGDTAITLSSQLSKENQKLKTELDNRRRILKEANSRLESYTKVQSTRDRTCTGEQPNILLAKLQAENHHRGNRIKVLDARIQQLESSMTEEIKEKEKWKSQNSGVVAVVDDSSEEEIARLRKMTCELEVQYRSASDRARVAESDAEDLRKQLQVYESEENSSCDSNKGTLYENRHNGSSGDNTDSPCPYDSMYEGLRTELRELQEENENLLTRFDSEGGMYKSIITELEEQLYQARELISENDGKKDAEFISLRTESEKKDEKMSSLSRENKTLRQDLDLQKNTIEELRTKYFKDHGGLSDALIEMKRLQEQLISSKEGIKTRDTQISHLSGQISSLYESHSSATCRITECEKDLSSSRSRQSELQKTITDLKTNKLPSKEKTIKTLKDSHKRLQSKFDLMKIELDNLQKERRLENQFLAKGSHRIDRARQIVTITLEDYNAEAERISELRSNIKEEKREIENLIVRMGELVRENDELKTQIDQNCTFNLRASVYESLNNTANMNRSPIPDLTIDSPSHTSFGIESIIEQ